MADDCDRADRHIQMDIQSALARHAGRRRGKGPEWIEGVPCCRECGEEIPEARVKALGLDAELCVRCAEAAG